MELAQSLLKKSCEINIYILSGIHNNTYYEYITYEYITVYHKTLIHKRSTYEKDGQRHHVFAQVNVTITYCYNFDHIQNKT